MHKWTVGFARGLLENDGCDDNRRGRYSNERSGRANAALQGIGSRYRMVGSGEHCRIGRMNVVAPAIAGLRNTIGMTVGLQVFPLASVGVYVSVACSLLLG